MLGWFKKLPVRRKVLLFIAGGMLTLVFDAFVAHYSWNRGTMKWNQWIPVLYGFAAFAGLGLAAVFPLAKATATRLTMLFGVLGIIVGTAGIYFHALELVEGLEDIERTFTEIGKAVSLAPPVFAPAAFAGIGLLLVTLHRITPEDR